MQTITILFAYSYGVRESFWRATAKLKSTKRNYRCFSFVVVKNYFFENCWSPSPFGSALRASLSVGNGELGCSSKLHICDVAVDKPEMGDVATPELCWIVDRQNAVTFGIHVIASARRYKRSNPKFVNEHRLYSSAWLEYCFLRCFELHIHTYTSLRCIFSRNSSLASLPGLLRV